MQHPLHCGSAVFPSAFHGSRATPPPETCVGHRRIVRGARVPPDRLLRRDVMAYMPTPSTITAATEMPTA